MASARQDYLMRQLSMIAEALRRLRAMLGGGASAAEIVAEIRAAEGELLGSRASVIRVLDSMTAARLVGVPEAVTQWAELLLIEAESLRQAGREAEAAAVELRAAQLREAAGQLG